MFKSVSIAFVAWIYPMPLSDAERQQRYRGRKEAQGAKRYQIMLPQSVAVQVREICKYQNCTKAELFSRLIDEEHKRVIK